MRTETKHDKKGEELTYMELGQGRRSCLMALFLVPPMLSMPVTYGPIVAFLGQAWSTSHRVQTIEFRPAIVVDLCYRSTHRQGKEAMASGERSRGTCCDGTRGAVAGREGEDYAM